MIAITFPDGAQRSFEPGVSGVDIAKSISPSLAKRTVADGPRWPLARPRRPHRCRCPARIHRPRRSARAGTDPPRRRPCACRGGAGAFSGHASHHRPGDRKRLLLRFLPRRAFHAGRFRRHRKKDARDHRRATNRFTKGDWTRDEAKAWFETHGEAFKVELVDAIPADQKISRSTSRATGSTSAVARI